MEHFLVSPHYSIFFSHNHFKQLQFVKVFLLTFVLRSRQIFKHILSRRDTKIRQKLVKQYQISKDDESFKH